MRLLQTPRIVVAPDSFKGTYPATQVAAAIAAGIRSAGVEAVPCPIADGGEGTMDAIVSAKSGTTHPVTVTGPLGSEVRARFGLIDRGRTAVVETAQASGLGLLPEHERDPWAATTRGTGELIVAAVRAGATRVIVAVGGSATMDGGSGALEAIRDAGIAPRISVVCDVSTPWEDAPRIFGPQKGADPTTVGALERRLDSLAGSAPRDPRGVPMTGCAGGLSGGLWAWLDAQLVAGAPYVLDVIGFDALSADAAAVVTGEGALDEQTFAGKAPGEVARRASLQGVPCHAVVGRCRLAAARRADLGLASVTEAGDATALRNAGARLAAAMLAGSRA